MSNTVKQMIEWLEDQIIQWTKIINEDKEECSNVRAFDSSRLHCLQQCLDQIIKLEKKNGKV